MQTAHPQTAYPQTAPRHQVKPVINATEAAWGIVLLLAWLGLPFLRELLVWTLMKCYEIFVMYF